MNINIFIKHHAISISEFLELNEIEYELKGNSKINFENLKISHKFLKLHPQIFNELAQHCDNVDGENIDREQHDII